MELTCKLVLSSPSLMSANNSNVNVLASSASLSSLSLLVSWAVDLLVGLCLVCLPAASRAVFFDVVPDK